MLARAVSSVPSLYVITAICLGVKLGLTEYLASHPRSIWTVFPLKTVQVGTLGKDERRKGGSLEQRRKDLGGTA